MIYTIFLKHSLADQVLSQYCWIAQEMCSYQVGDIIPNSSIIPYLVVLKARSFEDPNTAQIFKERLERVMKPHQLENGPRDKTKAMYKVPTQLNTLWQSCEQYIDDYMSNQEEDLSEDEVEYIPTVNPVQEDATYIEEDDNISVSSEDSMSDFIVPDDEEL